MRKNLPLILGFAIPILMVVFVIGTIYVPALIVKPHYGFVYATGNRYYDYGDHYVVESGKVIKKTIPVPKNSTNNYPYQDNLKLYIYDTEKDSSKEITLDEAQKLTLDQNIKSPDGFVLDQGYGNSGIFELFGSNRDYNAHYLKKGIVSKKIYLTTPSNNIYSYNGDIQFLGWVK
jgi:hypothetical protein